MFLTDEQIQQVKDLKLTKRHGIPSKKFMYQLFEIIQVRNRRLFSLSHMYGNKYGSASEYCAKVILTMNATGDEQKVSDDLLLLTHALALHGLFYTNLDRPKKYHNGSLEVKHA